MREVFERWYLQVTRGSPGDLSKDEDGQYKFVGREYLSWEAATLIKREECAKLCEAQAAFFDDAFRPSVTAVDGDNAGRCATAIDECMSLAAKWCVAFRNRTDVDGDIAAADAARDALKDAIWAVIASGRVACAKACADAIREPANGAKLTSG